MKKPKMSKTEKRIQVLTKLLSRRELEIANCNKACQEEVNQIERKNKFTRYQIEEIKTGRWPI